jgi:hypothetical protein
MESDFGRNNKRRGHYLRRIKIAGDLSRYLWTSEPKMLDQRWADLQAVLS